MNLFNIYLFNQHRKLIIHWFHNHKRFHLFIFEWKYKWHQIQVSQFHLKVNEIRPNRTVCVFFFICELKNKIRKNRGNRWEEESHKMIHRIFSQFVCFFSFFDSFKNILKIFILIKQSLSILDFNLIDQLDTLIHSSFWLS